MFLPGLKVAESLLKRSGDPGGARRIRSKLGRVPWTEAMVLVCGGRENFGCELETPSHTVDDDVAGLIVFSQGVWL